MVLKGPSRTNEVLPKRLWAAILIDCLLALTLPAAHYVASPEDGWPQFGGPCRNGVSAEKGLLSAWPEGGPPLLWSTTNLGAGYSAPVISGDTLYVTGDVGEELHIVALDLEGRLKWTATNGAAWKSPYPGARSSCTLSSGRVFHMNAHGRLACFDARDGQPIWDANVVQEFDSREPTWGFAESPLIDRNRVIVTPGGRKAAMAALDKESGKPVWRSGPVASTDRGNSMSKTIEGPSYASPILIEVSGRRHIVGFTARHVFGVNADNGTVDWAAAMPTRYEVLASSAALCGEAVFVTGPDGDGGKLLRLANREGRIGAEQVWSTTLDTLHGGVIPIERHLYGSFYRGFNGWGCVDLRDGRVAWRDKQLTMGSVVHADGHLYCLSQSGTMALIKPDPERLRIVSRFQFATEPRNDVWAHPVILDGRLYLRHQQRLSAYDIKAAKTPEG